MGTRQNRLAKAVLTSTYNLCSEQEYWKIPENGNNGRVQIQIWIPFQKLRGERVKWQNEFWNTLFVIELPLDTSLKQHKTGKMTFDTLPGNYNSYEEFEPGHSISYKIASAPNLDISQPLNWHSLSDRSFPKFFRLVENPKRLQADSEDPDQTARMRRLI